MKTIKAEILNNNTLLPTYATKCSAGADIRALLPNGECILLQPQHRTLVPTGIFVAIPEGYEIQIRPRSGLAAKHGITVLNSPGTIDSDYRGEIKVILINHSTEPFMINNGDRIAQMVLSAVVQIDWEFVNSLNITDRDGGGFGHTGNK